jgi:hypothetical protein
MNFGTAGVRENAEAVLAAPDPLTILFDAVVRHAGSDKLADDATACWPLVRHCSCHVVRRPVAAVSLMAKVSSPFMCRVCRGPDNFRGAMHPRDLAGCSSLAVTGRALSAF